MVLHKKKQFQFDVLLDRENICDRKVELVKLTALMNHNQRVVLYAPRRYGKTSLVCNAVAPNFKKNKKNAIVISVNLMDVHSIASLAGRMNQALAHALSQQIPIKHLLMTASAFIRNLSLNISVDPYSAQPSLQIGSTTAPEKDLEAILFSITQLSKKHPLLIILDEFQDIHGIPEAEALLRTWLQQLNHTAVAILGSKQSMLSDMFAKATSPFFSYGEELVLSPIPSHEWLNYFNQRLGVVNTQITEKAIQTLSDFLCDVPNALCKVGAWLTHSAPNETIDTDRCFQLLDQMLYQHEESLRMQLSAYSEKEYAVLCAIARRGFVKQPNTKEFTQDTRVTPAAINKMLIRFVKNGAVELEPKRGYRLSDPLLRAFLVRIGKEK